MISKLWNKIWQRDSQELNKTQHLEEEIKELTDKVNELSDTNKQMLRLQYKHNQELENKLNKVEDKIEKQSLNAEQKKRLEKENQEQGSIIKDNIEFLISLVDEIDLMTSKLSAEQKRWQQLLKSWRERILNKLSEQGIYEVALANTEFKPQLAEAIDILSKEELEDGVEYNNHEIVDILKRAYQNQEGNVIRKATVIIFKEGNND